MINFIKITLFVMCLFTFTGVSHAQDSTLDMNLNKKIEYGVKKHTMIPHNLNGIDQNKRQVNLDKLSGKNGIILFIVRSADWCPYCVEQLLDISRKGSIIEDYGYNIVVVSYDSVKKLRQFTRKYDFPYTMISDRKSEIIDAFQLKNNSYLEGTAFYGVARPAIYVIGHDGYIIEKFFDENFKTRLFVDDVDIMLRSIGDYTPQLKPKKVPVSETLNP